MPLEPIVVGRYFAAFSCEDGGWHVAERTAGVQTVGEVSARLMVDPSRLPPLVPG
ncbi:MAG: hypothetical protein NVSMB60_33320 [Mycobacterium sp.]